MSVTRQNAKIVPAGDCDFEALVGICAEMLRMDREATKKGNPIVKKTKRLVRKWKRGKFPSWEGAAKLNKFVHSGCTDTGYGNLGKETAYLGATMQEVIKRQDDNRDRRQPSELMHRAMILADTGKYDTDLQLPPRALTLAVVSPAGEHAMDKAMMVIPGQVIALGLREGSHESVPVPVPDPIPSPYGPGESADDPIDLEPDLIFRNDVGGRYVSLPVRPGGPVFNWHF